MGGGGGGGSRLTFHAISLLKKKTDISRKLSQFACNVIFFWKKKEKLSSIYRLLNLPIAWKSSISDHWHCLLLIEFICPKET